MDFLYRFFVYQPDSPFVFTNPLFWLFLGFVFVGYQYVYKNLAVRNLFLGCVSLFFYYKAGGIFVLLLLFSTWVDYWAGKAMYRSVGKRQKMAYLYVSLLANLGLLAYFKYSYWLVGLLNGLLGTEYAAFHGLAFLSNTLFGTGLSTQEILLPVGISFYTFQTMSYSIDIYREKLEPVNNFWDFTFYVSFFPQLVAGPIVRAADFIPQLYQPYQLNNQQMGEAVWLICVGLVKKVLIADYIAVNFVDRVFDDPALYTGFAVLMAIYGYALQIYCDFSGYSDIAIGLASLLGFRLLKNFDMPYGATSITDFWRRWHISLSSWLRDYLYISLGGNRKGEIRTYMNLMITMLLGGLWHGAAWRFVWWGGLHGLALVLHRLYQKQNSFKLHNPFLKIVLTFHFVCFCWIFFRAKDLFTIQQIFSQLFYNFEWLLIPKVIDFYAPVFILMLGGYFIHFLPKSWKQEAQHFFIFLPDWAKSIGIVLLILGLYQASTGYQPFIYFQF